LGAHPDMHILLYGFADCRSSGPVPRPLDGCIPHLRVAGNVPRPAFSAAGALGSKLEVALRNRQLNANDIALPDWRGPACKPSAPAATERAGALSVDAALK
jgi:hypothetical protein